MMRKLVLVLAILLFFSGAAMAYKTIVSVTINDMKCQPCRNGDDLTKIEGDGMPGGLFISESANCSTPIPGSERDSQPYIEQGMAYTSANAELTTGSTYHFCMQLSEYSGQAARYSLPYCHSVSATSYAFTLWPATVKCTGGNNSRVLIGASNIDTLTFAFPFIA